VREGEKKEGKNKRYPGAEMGCGKKEKERFTAQFGRKEL